MTSAHSSLLVGRSHVPFEKEDFDRAARYSTLALTALRPRCWKLTSLPTHLRRELTASLGGATSGRYAPLDAIYRYPGTTHGVLYCGNIDAAKTRSILDESNVTHVVNCTTDHPLFFEGAGIQVSFQQRGRSA